jgi:aminoglycoside 6'-N-acetyltransferase I
MNQLVIEPITSSNVLEACAHVLAEAYNAPPWNDSWTAPIALEKLKTFYDSPKFLGWVARNDNEVVGACIGNIEPYFTGNYFYLKEMFVSSQRMGVGKMMMKVLRERLDQMNVMMVILFTGNDKFPWDFYLKSGFVEMEGMRMMMLDESGTN